MKIRKIGSNQYKDQYAWYNSTYVNLLFIPLTFFLILGGEKLGNSLIKQVHAQNTKVISPIGEATPIPTNIPSITPTPELSEHNQIKEYIEEVFGNDTPKAMKLLSCENKGLRPDAVNDNTTWGGVGQDIGIFQINNKWQAVQNKFLYNWKINIQIAKQLFDENNGHFNLWSCGQQLGI